MKNKNILKQSILNRKIVSGDIVQIEMTTDCTGEHIYIITHQYGTETVFFRDLSRLFVKKVGSSIYCCSIVSGNDIIQLHKISEDDFIRLITGKRFRVFVDNDVFTLEDYSDEQSHNIMKDIITDRQTCAFGELDPRLVHSVCYQFEEISANR